jgi:RimJ/RimL family protein N-acetyltransferase
LVVRFGVRFDQFGVGRAAGERRGNGGVTCLEDDTILVSERLTLTPLRPEDAGEMMMVLADERLHEYIGGRHLTLEELRARYQRLAAGSPRPDEIWLNWIVRRSSDSQAVGTVQATITEHDDRRTAQVAWVIGVPWQNHGFASEAARALVAWLRRHDVAGVIAHIHPHHEASAIVARRAGLEPTEDEAGGEQIWRTR